MTGIGQDPFSTGLLWQPHQAFLAHQTDFDGFRREARRGLALGLAPADLAFSVDAARAGTSTDVATATSDSPLRLGAELLTLLQQAAMHAEPARFELMYRMLWRVRAQPSLQHDALDADRLHLATLAQAVRREQHKMKAFVRFRPVLEPDQATPLHVAWFEPEHHVVESVAPFFVSRFAGMRFSILTPRRSLRWDGETLHWAGGASREQAPAPDAGEALWLAYYAHIFNPARLKLAAMENEMPRRYWRNLPEAALIAPLAAAAASRSRHMLQTPGTQPRRRIPAAAIAADAPGHAARAAAAQLLPVPLAPMLLQPPLALPVSSAERLHLLADRQSLASHCRACPLGAAATQTVLGKGPIGARLMLVGEQPGDQEDLRGQPFVGPSGQLLERALQRLGVHREGVFLTNAVKHFKYGLRGKRRLHKTPAQQEALACLHWLEEEVALVQPQVLVALGRTAAKSLLAQDVVMAESRGCWFEHRSGTPVMVTWHPAALLRMPEADRAAAFEQWVQDLTRAHLRSN